MPLSGEAIRTMNYVDDISVTLRRILAVLPSLTDDERQRVANLALLNRFVVAGEAREDRQARRGRRSPAVRARRARNEIEDRAGVCAESEARGICVVRLVDPALVAHEDGRVPILVRLDGNVLWKGVRPRLALRGVEKRHRNPQLIR